MISSIGNSLTWAQHGQRIPDSSMSIYAQADAMVSGAEAELKDAATVQQTKDDAAAMKSAAEKQFLSAFHSIPASKEQARDAALNVLLCGTFSGALDTALYMALKAAPGTDTPPIADAELHAQMKEILAQLAGTAQEAPDYAQQLGKGAMEMMVNLTRSKLDEEVAKTAQLAGKSDEASCKAYATGLLHLFEGGYTVGSGAAALGGHSL